MITLRQRLKQETRDIHLRLEQESQLAALTSPTLTLDQYANILQKKHRLYQALEPKIQRHLHFDYVSKIRWLEMDLERMSINPIDAQPPAIDFPQPDEALGALYVIEGSTLGSQLITRHLGNSLPQLPHHFFSGYKAETGMRWKKYLSFLAQMEPKIDASRVVAGAQRTFEVIGHAFTQEEKIC